MRYYFPVLCICMGVIASITQPASGLPTLSTVATPISTSLPLGGEGYAADAIIKVANISIATDNRNGLTLTLTAGSLTKNKGQDIAIQITTVPHGAIAPGHSNFTVAANGTYSYVRDTPVAETRDVYIRYVSAALQDPGIYNTTIYVSVKDN